MRLACNALATGHQHLGGIVVGRGEEGEEEEEEEGGGGGEAKGEDAAIDGKLSTLSSDLQSRPLLMSFLASELMNRCLNESELGPSVSTHSYMATQRAHFLESFGGSVPQRLRQFDARLGLIRSRDGVLAGDQGDDSGHSVLKPDEFDRSLVLKEDEVASMDIDNLDMTKPRRQQQSATCAM